MTKTWRALAEAFGIETEAGLNFQKMNRRRQMQQYGTVDRRDKGDPLAMHRQRLQRQQAAAQGANMTPRPGGLSDIPAGADRPGQGNPLMAPPRREPAQAMRRQPDLAALVGADDEESEE